MRVKHPPAFQTAMLGLLAAMALLLSFLESLLPPLPVPGARLGLANVAILAALSFFGGGGGVLVGTCKVLYVLLTRGLTAAMLSGIGTAAALTTAIVLIPLVKREHVPLSYVGLSVVSAMAHTAGQLLTASWLLSAAVWRMSPFLLLFSIPTGVLTGLVLNVCIPRLRDVFCSEGT